jgi:hypothetical protein
MECGSASYRLRLAYTVIQQGNLPRGEDLPQSAFAVSYELEYLHGRKAVAPATARIMKACPCWVRVVPRKWNETQTSRSRNRGFP